MIWLQHAVGTTADGVIGAKTVAAARAADPNEVRSAMLAARLRFMTHLANWPAFSKGWSRRIADLMEMA